MNKLFRTKSILQLQSEAAQNKQGYKKALSATNLTVLGIGAIIGAGIFVLTGSAAAQYAGPAIVLSFIFSGLACLFAGLCYAEFASMIPVSGSAYTYAYSTLGEFIAWIIGWDLILEYLFAASTVAVGWSGYVVSFLNDTGIHIPLQLTAAANTVLVQINSTDWRALTDELSKSLANQNINITQLPHITTWFNLPAVLIVGIVTVLLVWGIKESAKFNNIMVIVKLAVIIAFVGIGFAYVNSDNWTPFIPDRFIDADNVGHFGWLGVLRGAGVIFFAYIGFDAVSTLAQEAKNPQRDIPRGILGSLGISTILYILVALVLTGLVSYTQLNVDAPVALGVNAMGEGMHWFRPIVKMAAIVGLSSVILVLLMGQPRIFQNMANDGLLPPVFAKMHPKYKTPYVSSIITGIVAMVVAGVMPIGILGELVSIGTLLAFVIVCVGIMILRHKRPNEPRPFRTPWYPVIPILGIITCLAQMFALPPDTWIRLAVWMLIGIVIYGLYSVRNSKLGMKDNDKTEQQ